MGTQGDGTEGEGNPLGQKIPRLHELTLGVFWGESPGICSI